MASALPSPSDCCHCTNTGTVTVNPTVGWFDADTAAAGRTYPAASTNKILVLNGLNAAGDGLGGVYNWSASSNAADDGMTVLNPNGNVGLGRWIKLI